MINSLISEMKEYTLFYTLVFSMSVLFCFLLLDRFKGLAFNKDSNKNKTQLEGLHDRIMNFGTDIITNENKMQLLEAKMNSFEPRPSYFYLDSGIVELMYSIKEFSNYSKPIFQDIIRLLDKFLKLTLYANQNESYVYDNLKDVKKEILNSMHFLIFNIPENIQIENKLDKAIDSMHYILNYHLEKIRLDYNNSFKERGPNIYNRAIPNDKVEKFNFNIIQEIYNHIF